MQFRVAIISIMTKNIRTILSPLLIMNYVLGLRIAEFPADQSYNPRLRLRFLYILLVWLIYCSALICTVIPQISSYTLRYHILLALNIIILLVSIVVEAYQDQKFRNCLKRLAILDDTLEKLGTMTDYEVLQTRTVWLVLEWFLITLAFICVQFFWYRDQYDFSAATIIYIIVMLSHSFNVNFIGDLTITSIFGYIGLKFDQVNKCLRQSVEDNKLGIRQDLGNPTLHLNQRELLQISSNWITWTIIHLHAELCRISQEVNTIFGIQMTLKMGNYYGCIALGLCEIFNLLLISNYINNKVVYSIMIIFWTSLYIFRFLLINYMCEKVSTKAYATGDVINKILCSTYDVEIRENMSQLLLKVSGAPLKFWGCGFFQFGLKYLHNFVISIANILVIIIQSHVNTK